MAKEKHFKIAEFDRIRQLFRAQKKVDLVSGETEPAYIVATGPLAKTMQDAFAQRRLVKLNHQKYRIKAAAIDGGYTMFFIEAV
jgi:hypothetical protein